ncbi:phage minor head protein [Chitinophaga sp. MM2321]|uniref:phage minor head protein n=1 Tax=Chitinophaga sp. MM2321 TaxID=3137178 RepID=UPI0032D59F3B
MNRQQRREYYRTYSAFQIKQERYWLPKIYKALQANNDAFATYLIKNGTRDALAMIDRIVTIDPIINLLQLLYKVVGLRRGRIIQRSIKEQVKISRKAATLGFNEQLTKEIQRFFELFLLNKSVIPITNTQKEAIRQVLAKGVEEGLGVEQLARKITGMPYTRKQARVVVRTETVRASNAAAEITAQQSEYLMEKEWISANDDRVRRPPKSHYDHWDLDGQVVPGDRPFFSGGEELMFPGDPNGSAGNVIQCRCTVAYTIVVDANGRLIKKPSGSSPARYSSVPKLPVTVPDVGVNSDITIIHPSQSNITQIITIGIKAAFFEK